MGFAKDQFVLSQGTISIVVPKGWQSAKDLFGVPLTFLGPESDGGRPIISITPTGLRDYKFDQKSLEKNQDEYKTSRESWLQEKEGKSLKYFPYKVEHRKDGVDLHVIGYSYEFNDIIFSEYSYYIFCGGQLFHSKVLLRRNHENQYQKIIDEMIGSFECK